MSFPFYNKLWIATKKDLKNVVLREKVLPQLEPTLNRVFVHRLIGNLFARYIVLCNNLSELHDQTLQVQKQPAIEQILISSTKRLLELQKEIRKIEMSEYVYLDDALMELKMTPENIEFLRPFYFPRKRDIEAQQVIDELPTATEGVQNKDQLKGLDKYRKVLTLEELEAQSFSKSMEKATNLIKIHEKAKQSRVNWLNMKLFPDIVIFKPKRRETVKVTYDFIHRPDQVPLHKIKRTNYKTNLYKPKVNIAKFSYYEPPKFRINRLGQAVLIPKKVLEINERIDDVESELDDDELAQKDKEQNLLQEIAQTDLQKKRVSAAIKIQRFYRSYRSEKALNKRNFERKVMCGLLKKPDDYDKPKQSDIDEALRKKRRERKKEYDEVLIKALEDKKARILKVKSAFIMEDISDDIRQWFKEFYDNTKDFHRYPEEFEGGTIMVVRGETQTPKEFLIEKNKKPAQKAKEKENKKRLKKALKLQKKKQAVLDKKAEIDRIKLEMKQGPTWNFAEKKYQSKNFDDLEKCFSDYENDWKFVDETVNRTEAPIWDWVTIDAYADVHKELRAIVDDFMRIELELLRVALAVNNKTAYVRPKPKKEKKKKKKKRVKKEDDVSEGRSLKECYEELKSLNIIRKYPKRSLNDFIGDENFAALEMRMMNKNPVPHYGNIKNILRYLVLGMGPIELPKIKSLCIAGPPKCGKKFLVEALCTDMDALMFDLSPINVAPIQDIKKTLDLVMKMAKTFEPSVIFIDGAHKPFIRKMTDDEKAENPKKLGSYLLKSIVKKLTNEDAVMLMSTTNQPFNCNFEQLKQCYEKIIMFPPTLDYGTALMAWNKGLELKNIYNFDSSALARVTRNYTIGEILEMINDHLNIRRRMVLLSKPLTSSELLESFLTGPFAKKPLDEKTIESYKNFGLMIDPFNQERTQTMARVQVQINKEKELEAKRKEMLKKKAEKKQ